MMRIVHLGDLDVVLPLAAALAAWLFAAGAWRTALRWGLCFGAAVMLVGASKIAFLGWGTGLAAFEFKAVSGHATVVTALYPVAAWVLLYRPGVSAACIGFGTALGLGVAIAMLLVIGEEHTFAEAASGWLLGAAVSVAGVTWSHDLRTARLLPGLWWSLPVFAIGAWLMQSAHVGYWMVKLALALSGNSHPHSWDTCG